MRACKAHKAAGSDNIAPELLKNASRWVRHWLAPLLAKCSFYVTEPIQWRGGVLHELYKGKGSMTDTKSYRGILVSSHLAKSFLLQLSRKTLPFHVASAPPLQTGGMPKKGVDLASHTLRAFLDLGKKHGRSIGIFFLDVQSAFYRLLRCLAVGPTCTTPELLHLLHTVQIPDNAVEALLAASHQPDAFTRMGVPAWLRKFGVVFHSHTWYHVRQDPEVCETLRGTRPGDGYADLLFGVVTSQILQDLEPELAQFGVQTCLEWNGFRNTLAAPGEEAQASAIHVVWADDIAVMLHHEQPAELIYALKNVMALYMDRLAQRGLLLNMAPGKSEALVLLRGKGSRALRRDLFKITKPTLDFESAVFGTQQVSLISKYKHLGFTVHGSGFLLAELRIRAGSAHSAFTKHAKRVYYNLGLRLAKRSQIFKTCVLSILLWNSGTWSPMRASEWRFFHGAYLRLLRRFLSKDAPTQDTFGWSEIQLCSRVEVLPLEEEIRCLRLGYYGRLARHGPDALWALLATDQTWLSLIPEDIDWLFKNSQSMVPRLPPRLPGGADYWNNIATTQPKLWVGLIKKAKAHRLLQIKSKADVQFFHNGTLNFLEQIGVDLPFNPDEDFAQDASVPQFFCVPCLAGFKTRSGWAVHAFRKHGRKARARYLAEGTQCDHCLHTFSSTNNLYLHLRYSTTCFGALRSRGLCVEPAPGRGSRGWSCVDAFSMCPYLVAEGPFLPVEHTDGLGIDTLSPHEEALFSALLEIQPKLLEDDLDPDEIWEALRQVLRAFPISLEEMQTCLRTWKSLVQRDYPRRRLRPAFVAQLFRALDTAVDRCTYPWICPDLMSLGPRCCNRPRAPEIIERLEPTSLRIPSPSDGPHFVQPVIVHFFSGRRRSGDYQQALEELTLPPNSWQPIILSVDIVLSQRWGNLTDPVVRRFWLRQAYLGSLTAFLAGPPCESFSVARERWRSDGWGPRPLRSASEPWGYDSLLLREVLQTYIGNSLLTFVLELFLYMWLNRRPGIIEHPAEPSTSKHPEAPSIWKLAFMHIVAEFPEVGFLTVHQGNFGAVSPKPTTLLHCHCIAELWKPDAWSIGQPALFLPPWTWASSMAATPLRS